MPNKNSPSVQTFGSVWYGLKLGRELVSASELHRVAHASIVPPHQVHKAFLYAI